MTFCSHFDIFVIFCSISDMMKLTSPNIRRLFTSTVYIWSFMQCLEEIEFDNLLGERVDLKSVVRRFSKVAKMVHSREERRKSGRKSRGPFLLEGKRWLQLSRYLRQCTLGFLCGRHSWPASRRSWKSSWETRYIGCSSVVALCPRLAFRIAAPTLSRHFSRHRRGIIKAGLGWPFSGLVNHRENLYVSLTDTQLNVEDFWINV